MLKKIAGGLLILAILCYIVSIAVKNASVYFICFTILVTTILFGLLVLTMDFIWKSFPVNSKKTYKLERNRFYAIVFFSVLLFYIVSGVTDETCLPEASGFISLLGNITAFIFTVFLGWSSIRRAKKAILAGSVIFIIFIAALSFVSSSSLKAGEIAKADSVNQLKTLPYLIWVDSGENIEKTGVVQYHPDSAFDGINIYNSGPLHEAYLINMQGDILHKWRKEVTRGQMWDHVEMCDNGDLVVEATDQTLIHLDWESRVKWKKKMEVHHDICIDQDDKIYVITRELNLVFWHGIPLPINNDYIVVLSPNDGQIKKKTPLFNIVKGRIPAQRIIKIYKGFLRIFKPKNIFRLFIGRYSRCKGDVLSGTDLLHTNNIEVMDRDFDGFCKYGDWLISMRELDLIGIVDPEKQQLVWSWGPGQLSRQHNPTLLENGNVLIFDNGTINGYSRIIELNPLTKQIVWEYKSEPPEEFFSPTRGCSQRLPNGNTLITESDDGRVFEITEEGRIVWEFYNPHINKEDKTRGSIYRMIRITNPEIQIFLKNQL